MPSNDIRQRFATPNPGGPCPVCRRATMAGGIWANDRFGGPIIWLCDDLDCVRNARSLLFMPQAQLDGLEILARNSAGRIAGRYLDSVGMAEKPISDWSQEIWFEFLSTYTRAFEQELRKLVNLKPAKEPPDQMVVAFSKPPVPQPPRAPVAKRNDLDDDIPF